MSYTWRLNVNSLKSRLVLSAIFMVLVLLPIVGLTISNAYQKHMESAVSNELTAYSYSILAVAEFEQGNLLMPEAVAEDRFNTSHSGLYGAISELQSQKIMWQSSSLLAMELPRSLPTPSIGSNQFTTINLDDATHFIYSFTVSFSDNKGEHPVTLHIIKEQINFQQLMSNFKQQLWLGLLILMAVLLVLQVLWLRWSLKPLTLLKTEIAGVERGQHNQLSGKYPKELEQVTEQLNTLLQTEQMQRKRYRNALSDLAHSLKTPLAVLQGQVAANTNDSAQEQIDVMTMMIEHQLKRAQSAGQSSWHLGINILPVLDKLTNSLRKIYRDKVLIIDTECAQDYVFKGDEADLLEILGNLLDNACKAARSQVSVVIFQKNNLLHIMVEDDGKGILATEIETILQRGKRADTYQQGHGVGLAIVRDLVDSYQGKLTIASSETLGGASFHLTFTV